MNGGLGKPLNIPLALSSAARKTMDGGIKGDGGFAREEGISPSVRPTVMDGQTLGVEG